MGLAIERKHSIHGVCNQMIFTLLSRGLISPENEGLHDWLPTEKGIKVLSKLLEKEEELVITTLSNDKVLTRERG